MTWGESTTESGPYGSGTHQAPPLGMLQQQEGETEAKKGWEIHRPGGRWVVFTHNYFYL